MENNNKHVVDLVERALDKFQHEHGKDSEYDCQLFLAALQNDNGQIDAIVSYSGCHDDVAALLKNAMTTDRYLQQIIVKALNLLNQNLN